MRTLDDLLKSIEKKIFVDYFFEFQSYSSEKMDLQTRNKAIEILKQ